MDTAQFWYLPLAPVFFLILFALPFFVFVLLLFWLMQHAYEQLGRALSTVFSWTVSLPSSSPASRLAATAQANAIVTRQ